VLFGAPIPNPVDLAGEAGAIFWDESRLDTDRVDATWILKMRDGRDVPVKGWRYLDSRMQAYWVQKSPHELYQALHRCRPHRVGPDERKDVLVYTNMPIPGVVVDGFLGWEGRCVRALEEILANKSMCSAPELARHILDENEKFNTVEMRIRRDAGKLAFYAGIVWDTVAHRFRTSGI
jgi:hypothetical protein